MTEWLTRRGQEVNRKRVRRLMRAMVLEVIYSNTWLSLANSSGFNSRTLAKSAPALP
jgi:hypothetical protein